VNRLAQEPSPYLRQHAANPVDWFPWGDEALEESRRSHKPILLSIGYSACHWCHVMAHESFENPAIAKQMNAQFVNVKVDREERPDLDQLYQGVVQLMGRGGGWPLTVFLTPDLRPFFGGTYFPPADRHGMPGFPKLLDSLATAWRDRPGEVEEQAEQFREGLTDYAMFGLDSTPGSLTPRDVVAAAKKLGQEVDPTYGGFGGAPKFPNAMSLALMMRGWRRGASELWEGLSLTLERMARGGIYDQLGGGFHRYSTDRRWLVPHFEKMLYDNAQLIHLYSEAFQVRPRPLWQKVVEETVAYVRREMTSPEGCFFSAQDADSEGEEGKFFVWTDAEVKAALPAPEAAAVVRHFGMTPQGNFEGGRTILEVVEELGAGEEASLSRACNTLFEVRRARVAPGLDDKVLAGWNGLMIRGLAFASRVFGRPEWAGVAARAADALWARMWKSGRLMRALQGQTARIEGFLEDYGDLAAGLTSLYQATFEPKYLDAALALADKAHALFWDDEKRAYTSAPRGQKDLLCATYALHDNAYPSGASSLTEAQLALAALTGQPVHLERATRYLEKMREEMVRNPFAYGHLMTAADTLLDGASEVVIASGLEAATPLLGALNGAYAPTVAVALKRTGDASGGVLAGTFAGKELVGGRPAAYLCRNFACEAPVTEPAGLRARLETWSNR
jgi:uncharacterized protein YyaL (SSP411 family)